MKMKNVRALLVGGMAGVAMLFGASAAQAAGFKFGEVDVKVDTTMSVGVGVRTSKQDCTHVSVYNGGCRTEGQNVAFGVNDDDGNVNTDQWDLYTAVAKITSDIDVQYQNYGGFFRVKAFYDYWADQELGQNNGIYGKRPLDDTHRHSGNTASRDIQILDAFVYGNFDVAGQPLSLRVGKQVINWGESLAIAGGISSYLPVDVSALRTPGSELKEAYQPVPAIYASLGLPNNFSIEAFWQFQWDRTRVDACGTYFATTDAICEGGAYVMSAGEYPTAPIQIFRKASEEGDDYGTWGASLKYYADWLNDGTDTGLYFVNYASPLPIGTFTAGDFAGAASAALGAPIANFQQFCGAFGYGSFGTCAAGTTPFGVSPILLGLTLGGNTKSVLAQYPDDIQTLGASFNTVLPILGGSAFSGEASYTHDMPFQLSDVEINCTDLINAGLDTFAGAACRPDAPSVAAGQTIRGYDRFNVWGGQLSLISTLPTSNALTSMLGSDIVVLVANAGFQYIPGLDSGNNRLSIARSSVSHPNPTVAAILGDSGCTTGGTCQVQYATPFSWGYRLIASTDYNNAFGTAWTLSPNIAFGHDVDGYSAGPIGPGFVQGKKAVTIGVGARLQSALRASIGYTHNWGNPYRNFSSDKDFATATVSYAF